MSIQDTMKVTVPEGVSGDWRVERFTVEEKDMLSQLGSLFSTGRAVPPGAYTRLTRGGTVVMSDTPDELRDHLDPAIEIRRRGGRVLIGGLGLGCVLRAALHAPAVEHVDVVERSADVITLVGSHYQEMAEEVGVSLTIHKDDVFEKKWPPGTRWTTAWFDIWDNMCEGNYPEFTRLLRSYGRRADWKGCWSKAWLDAHRGRWGW